MHVEVRRQEEPLRAKGAFPIEPINPGKKIEEDLQGKISVLEIKNVGEDYLLAETSGGVLSLGSFWGLGCTINHQLGILDCGLPHYGYGGVHLIESPAIEAGDPVRLWGVDIGSVTRVYKNFALFRCRPLAVYVDDTPFRGFSLYLWLRENKKVKIVPKEPLTRPTTFQKLSHIKLRRR